MIVNTLAIELAKSYDSSKERWLCIFICKDRPKPDSAGFVTACYELACCQGRGKLTFSYICMLSMHTDVMMYLLQQLQLAYLPNVLHFVCTTNAFTEYTYIEQIVPENNLFIVMKGIGNTWLLAARQHKGFPNMVKCLGCSALRVCLVSVCA